MGGERIAKEASSKKMQASEWTSQSPEQTLQIGQQIGALLPSGSLVCLFGDLGAGKTTLIKGIIASVTGISPEEVVSPTFVTLQLYGTVAHFDLYRLRGPQEFLSSGFEEYLYGDQIVCMEWSERIEPLLPSKKISLFLEHLEEGKRSIRMHV